MRNNLGTKLLCGLLISLSVCAFVVATCIDVDFWTSIAKSDLAKLEYAGGSVIFRGVVFLFAAVVALQWRAGKRKASMLAGLILLTFASIGISSVVGFGARERMAPTMMAEAKYEAELKAKQEADALSIKLRNEQIAFLREQAKKAPGPQSRQVAYDALANGTFGTVEVKAAPVAEITDPLATAINARFPAWSVQDIQFATSVAFGVCLILAEIVCMSFGVGMWPKAPDPRKEEAVPVVNDSLTTEDVRPSAEIIRPEQFTKTSQPKAEDKEEAAVEALATDLFGDVQEHMTDVAAIEQFWGTQTRPAPVARIAAKAMYTAYCGWAASKSLRPASAQMFGRVASRLGMERDKTNPSQWAYVGRALIDVDDGAVILAA